MNTKDFAATMQNDPKQIIAWCRKEIKLYEELIEILSPNSKTIKIKKGDDTFIVTKTKK